MDTPRFRSFTRWFLFLTFAVSLASAGLARAEGGGRGLSGLADFYSGKPPVPAPVPAQRPPGVALAEGLSQLTGVAISPLLGVTVIGAWQYYHPVAGVKRPWYAHPYFWGTATVLLALVFLKDLLGTATPAILKKPFDLAELFENKLSAMVACGAFVPLFVSQLLRFLPEDAAVPLHSSYQYASVLGTLTWGELRFVAIPMAMAAFAVVWLASHAINVLIVLSPFSAVDSLLKLLKGFLLGTVAVSSLLSPYFGAVVCLVLIALALRLAPWAFRLTVFGAIFGGDVLLSGWARRRVRHTEPHAFAAGALPDVPVRTYGRLARLEDGGACFIYRPWLVLPERRLVIPPGEIALAKGLLYPSLLHRAESRPQAVIAVIFLPRYRAQEQFIAEHFGIHEIQENRLVRGLQAIRRWLAETFTPSGPARLSSNP